MNIFRLKFVSCVLAGILLPQAGQANMDIVDIPINEFVNNTDKLLATSHEVIVKLKEGKEIPQSLLDQKLDKYNLTKLINTNTLIVQSDKFTSDELATIFNSMSFMAYVDSVSLNEEHKNGIYSSLRQCESSIKTRGSE